MLLKTRTTSDGNFHPSVMRCRRDCGEGGAIHQTMTLVMRYTGRVTTTRAGRRIGKLEGNVLEEHLRHTRLIVGMIRFPKQREYTTTVAGLTCCPSAQKIAATIAATLR